MKHGNPQLECSDIVRVRFEFQKNDKRDINIHMFRTQDKVLNPVKAWAVTVQRVRSYHQSNDDTKVCAFVTNDGKLINIQADQVRTRLRAVVETIGEEKLGFTKDEVGLHSIRSGGAMAMFLSGTSTIIIRRVGRWSSEAFLEYIREQVEDFTQGVSSKMIQFENFNNLSLPDKADETKSGGKKDNNEDGPECVPYAIQFSRLALESEGGEIAKRRHKR